VEGAVLARTDIRGIEGREKGTNPSSEGRRKNFFIIQERDILSGTDLDRGGWGSEWKGVNLMA